MVRPVNSAGVGSVVASTGVYDWRLPKTPVREQGIKSTEVVHSACNNTNRLLGSLHYESPVSVTNQKPESRSVADQQT